MKSALVIIWDNVGDCRRHSIPHAGHAILEPYGAREAQKADRRRDLAIAKGGVFFL